MVTLVPVTKPVMFVDGVAVVTSVTVVVEAVF